MEITFLRNALIRGIFNHAPHHSKLAHKFLSSQSRQKKITHFPRKHSFENLFPPTAVRGGRSYALLYQSSAREYEDELEDKVFYILHDLQFLNVIALQFGK